MSRFRALWLTCRSGVLLTFLLPSWRFIIIGLAGAYGVLGAILLLEQFGGPASSHMLMR
jgi:hypothetical protein